MLLAFLLSGIEPVFAEDDPLETLGFTDRPKELPVTTSRSPRPSSRIAENVTVITADDIVRLNAHTLSDVLQTVPGIQLDYLRTPSSFTYFNIQGALNTTVLVLIDGIRQNDFDQNMALPGLIPVQEIERIEIIKGAASASWGSALGGVINIITKSPNPERPVAGMVSGSIGSKFTADTRAELSGTKERFGYYLTASNLRSDGFATNTATNMNNLYGKLMYTLPGNGTVTFGLSQLNAKPGVDGGVYSDGFYHDNNEFSRTNSFLKLYQPLGANLSLDIDGFITRRDEHAKRHYVDLDGVVYDNDWNLRDATRNTNARITWGDSEHQLVTGAEFVHANASVKDLTGSSPFSYDRNWDRWALYGNGTYTIDKLTVLPGIRFDRTGLVGDNMSYTLGATYQLTDNTTLRTYAAQGFSLPNLNTAPNLQIQKIKTIQCGIESGAVPYLWLKGTYFYNVLRDSQSSQISQAPTNQNRQGFEVEFWTIPLFDFSLAGGYTYLYAKNSDTGAQLQSDIGQAVPPHIVKLALNYSKTELGLRGTLTGNYVRWNAVADSSARDNGMIWDLHLNWKVKPQSDLSPELFFSGHNLFNGIQTAESTLNINAPRWFEGGVRVNF